MSSFDSNRTSFNAVDIIGATRDKIALSSEQITWFIEEYTANRLPDYQVAAWLMAVVLNGLTRQETVNLTMAMVDSGEKIDLSDAVPFAVDKHSTGGVGDKTSLVVLPMVVACGVPVAKMSGRGLGHSGGTIDKLESFTGWQAEVPIETFKRLAHENKLVLVGQTANLAPADKAIYALRDVTGTVSSIPLIASSVMSKKIAGGADAIVLDVKVGEGAFMQTIEDAQALSQLMVDIGVDVGRAVTAIISDMNQPLGIAAGNAIEVREAIDTLKGKGPSDFEAHCLEIAAHMLILSPYSNYQTLEEAKAAALASLKDGSAFEKFKTMVVSQGGDPQQVDDPSLLPSARLQVDIKAEADGYIAQIDARQIGQAIIELGGGREKKGDPIDYAVGIETWVKVGQAIKAGDLLFRIHANDEKRLQKVKKRLEQETIRISQAKVEALPLFYDTIQGKPQ